MSLQSYDKITALKNRDLNEIYGSLLKIVKS